MTQRPKKGCNSMEKEFFASKCTSMKNFLLSGTSFECIFAYLNFGEKIQNRCITHDIHYAGETHFRSRFPHLRKEETRYMNCGVQSSKFLFRYMNSNKIPNDQYWKWRIIVFIEASSWTLYCKQKKKMIGVNLNNTW